MSDGDACACGWLLPPDTEVPVFVQCTPHREQIAHIEVVRGRHQIASFEYEARGQMDAEIEDRLRHGFRGAERPAAPRPGRRS